MVDFCGIFLLPKKGSDGKDSWLWMGEIHQIYVWSKWVWHLFFSAVGCFVGIFQSSSLLFRANNAKQLSHIWISLLFPVILGGFTLIWCCFKLFKTWCISHFAISNWQINQSYKEHVMFYTPPEKLTWPRKKQHKTTIWVDVSPIKFSCCSS